MTKVQRETMNVLFFIKKTKLLRNVEAPICVRITVNRQSVEIRIKRKRLSKYIFYSSFSLLTFATKK